jgi:hypothetical protein
MPHTHTHTHTLSHPSPPHPNPVQVRQLNADLDNMTRENQTVHVELSELQDRFEHSEARVQDLEERATFTERMLELKEQERAELLQQYVCLILLTLTPSTHRLTRPRAAVIHVGMNPRPRCRDYARKYFFLAIGQTEQPTAVQSPPPPRSKLQCLKYPIHPLPCVHHRKTHATVRCYALTTTTTTTITTTTALAGTMR